VSGIREGKLNYHYPFLNLAKKSSVAKQLYKEFQEFGFSMKKIKQALYKGYQELALFKEDIRKKGEKTLSQLKIQGERGIVLSGHPYHLDPEIHHKISEIIIQEGFHVLTEDSISHLSDVGDLRVVNQWMYHARLYSAARMVAKSKNLELVQLNSFGCGIDAVTTDQVEEILTNAGKIYTVLKIDEGANLGAVKIRLRSLKAAIESREQQSFESLVHKEEVVEIPTFTKEMKKTHTLLMPMMSPIHQEGLIDEAFEASGYNVVVLSDEDSQAVEVGLKYVNNDVCYPAILSIGRMIEALQSGDYDINQTSVMMTQTGGGCRATNYIPLLRKALAEAGFSQVPVVALSVGNQGVEVSPGFKLTISLLKRLVIAVLYGDLFERLVYRTRPYELEESSIDRMHRIWLESVRGNVRNGSFKQFNQNMKEIINNFDEIPLTNECKPRVGVVGEILVKYAPMANHDIVRLLEAEGAEAVVPDLLGFMNYSFYNQVWRYQNLGTSKKANYLAQFFLTLIKKIVQPMDKELRESKRFSGIASIDQLVKGASSILSIGNHTGEGWFLTGEMVELIRGGVDNIICMQPFGCLPNHVVGKGALKELRRQHPQVNVVTIDYDPGASFVNQLNRIRLMLATAKKRMAVL
jgi:predicted nucleotide-binding protein (sugar kinase/HSP70/actin superfamily)